MNSGNCNRSGLDFAVSSEQLLKRPERTASEFLCRRIGPQQVWIDHANQAHRFPSLLKLFVDARVIPPECAYSDNRDIDDAVGVQERFSVAEAAGCKL